MFIESKLRTRIIESLRWCLLMLNDRRPLLESTREFTEAVCVLGALEGTYPAPSEQQCRDMAAMLGKPDSWGSGYFRTYASQGWCKGNGVPITDVRLHMQELKNRGVEYPDAPTEAPAQDAQGMTPRQRHIQETGR